MNAKAVIRIGRSRSFAAISEGYHLDKRHWITVVANADVPDDMLCDLVRDSYDLVAARRPARRASVG